MDRFLQAKEPIHEITRNDTKEFCKSIKKHYASGTGPTLKLLLVAIPNFYGLFHFNTSSMEATAMGWYVGRARR